MKQLILEFSGSNMAGYSWSWEFYMTSSKTGKLTLSARQIVSEDAPMHIDPVRGLIDGVDVYEAMSAMVEEAGYSLEETDLPAIVGKISILNAVIAEQFAHGPLLAEERDEKEKERAANEQEAVLRPYREIIDKIRFDVQRQADSIPGWLELWYLSRLGDKLHRGLHRSQWTAPDR